MSFPINPVNGQTANVNGVQYAWNSTLSVWTVRSSMGSIVNADSVVSTGNVTGAAFNTAGTVSATGNITGSYFIGNGSALTSVTASLLGNLAGNIAGNGFGASALTFVSATGNIETTAQISATGTVTGGNLVTAGFISAPGNITGGNILGGAIVDGITHTGTIVSVTGNITGGNLLTAGLISATGNITGGNILGGANVNATTHTGTTVSVTGNITGGNIITGGLISATGNITGGNILGGANVNATTHTGTTVSVTANIDGGNLRTSGLISATGTVTSSDITTSRAAAPTQGYVYYGNSGTRYTGFDSTNFVIVNMPVSAAGNVTGSNILTAGLISATGNITGGNLSGTSIVGTLTTAAQTNITSVGTLSSLTTAGNIFINASAGNPMLEIKTAGAGNNPFVRYTASTNYWDIIGAFSDATDPIIFQYNGSTQLTLTNNGNVSAGNLTCSSGTVTAATLVETSSLALKENINPITNALDTIRQLVGVTYDRKDGSHKNEAGLIAEDVEKVLPNLIGYDEQGKPLGIHYTKLTAYLIEAVKELTDKIKRLENQ